MTHEPLPPQALAALQAGNKLEAIKQVRLARGVSLAEAKAWVESHEQGFALRGPKAVAPFVIPQQAVDAMRNGDLLHALRIFRDAVGGSLAEAKAVAEKSHHAGARATAATTQAHARRHSGEVRPTPLRQGVGLSPGEVPRGSRSGPWGAIIVIGAILIAAALWWR